MSETDGISNDFRQTLLNLDAGMIARLAHAGGVLRRDGWPCGLTRQDALQMVEPLWQAFPDCIGAVLTAFQQALPGLSRKEINEWINAGWRFQKAFPSHPRLCVSYFQASPVFFSTRAFGNLDAWVDEALRIAAISIPVAGRYMDRTPEFVDRDSLLHLREWSEKIREILGVDPEAQAASLGFIEFSPRLLEKITFRIFQSWHAAGMQLMRKSPTMAGRYFSEIPRGLFSLYQTEMRKIFDLTAKVAKELPGKAVELYQSAAAALLNLNPNVRERVLDITRKNGQSQPDLVQDVFNRIVAGIQPLSYPDQEMVINSESTLGSLSARVSNVYFDNAAVLLESVRPSFFPFWVEAGCLRLAVSEQDGIDYFGFDSRESRDALAKWKEAVFLEDCEKQLSVFARALCDREIRLKASGKRIPEEKEAFRQSPEESGEVLYLPAFIAEDETAPDNFRQYKVAVAHQAGYIEFGTFGPEYAQIRLVFKTFPIPELIRDIFFILEDGRIDRCLRANYRGLCQDLDGVLNSLIRKRNFPQDSALHEALEVLLRLVYRCLDETGLSPGVRPFMERFHETLSDFYTPATTVADVVAKAVDIYHLLTPLIPTETYIPFQSLEYLAMSDLDLMSDGDGDEVPQNLKSGEDTPGEGVSLSEEDKERLLELLKNISLIEPIKKGQGGKGILIEDLTGQVVGEPEDSEDINPEPESRIVVSGGLSKLTTRKGPFFYDEWDYLQKDYRRKWCCLREVAVAPAQTDLYEKIYSEYNDLIKDVKRQFQRIRPEELEQVKRLEWGNEIDFNAMIQNVVDRKTGDTPSDRIFSRREKKRRRISTFLLIDMSASTDRMAASLYGSGADHGERPNPETGSPLDSGKRIIDIEIESLVVIAEALEALDDSYAIFGFSGYGREQVELFSIKDFADPYSQETKNRICGIQPRKSTRMGPAIRHASKRLRETDSDHQLLIMLSDGYPQDMNYGEDRTSQTYALHDTRMALIESKRSGIRPFCITIDQCGDDYLRRMIDPGGYLVIKDIYSLPAVLPRVVESLMG
ncbi:MAG: hypothetical protein ABIK68_18455 [bacterium]